MKLYFSTEPSQGGPAAAKCQFWIKKSNRTCEKKGGRKHEGDIYCQKHHKEKGCRDGWGWIRAEQASLLTILDRLGPTNYALRICRQKELELAKEKAIQKVQASGKRRRVIDENCVKKRARSLDDELSGMIETYCNIREDGYQSDDPML